MKKIVVVIFSIIFVGLFSCTLAKSNKFPEILTAKYTSKTYEGTEMGYAVILSINKVPGNAQLIGIVLNHRLFSRISPVQINTGEILVEQYFPVSSQKIKNFQEPPSDKRADGIVFEIDGSEKFYEVTFKTK